MDLGMLLVLSQLQLMPPLMNMVLGQIHLLVLVVQHMKLLHVVQL